VRPRRGPSGEATHRGNSWINLNYLPAGQMIEKAGWRDRDRRLSAILIRQRDPFWSRPTLLPPQWC
jgi:hypothetical protein